jgi:prolyl 4-hydroxylase
MITSTRTESMRVRQELDGLNVFVIHAFLAAEECTRLITLSEDLGYREAPLSTAGGPVMDRSVRNNARVLLQDPALAATWWTWAQPFVPTHLDGCEAVGLNECFRFYRYDVGETFAPHYDGYFRRENSERSRLTFLVYLNEACEGGETGFYRPDGTPRFSVQPCGKALVFAHRQLHDGKMVFQGRKYVLRTDVMYCPPTQA